MDVLRWRRRKSGLVAPSSPSGQVNSAAGRELARYGAPSSALAGPALVPGRGNSGRRAMTASASMVEPGDRKAAMKARYARQGWQSEAFAYIDGVGELRYAVQTSANAVARIRMYPAIQLDPKEPPVDLSEVGTNDMPASVVAAAYEDLRALEEPGHGLSGMQHVQSINKQVVGEYYIVGLPYDPETGEESWTIRSIDEIVIDTDGRMYLRDRPPGFNGYDEPPMLLGPDVYVARCWDQHPRFRALAWSQMRPLLESLEELLLASRMIRSTLRSRIAGSGILLVPDELELMGINPTDQDAQSSPFFEELTKAMLTPIQSEGDASEVVPMVVRGPAEILKELRHLTLDRPIDAQAMAIRGELIRRIAIGIDWPPELLLGVGDVSHWAQWYVDESTFRYHYEPQVISSARQWTQGYAQPMLMAREWDPATAEKANNVVWWYDATELLTHPDRAKDAITLHTMDVLSNEALLRAAGFDPDTDQPSESEFLVRLMSKFRTFPPNVVEAIVHRYDGTLDIPADKAEPGEGPGGATAPISDPPSGGGSPAAPEGDRSGRGGPPDQAARARSALERLLARSGERIVITAAGGDPQVSTGAMVALYPTAEQAQQLALDGGEDPESLHVTLAYLGKAADLTPQQKAAAASVCSAMASLHAPLEGTYAGVARFSASESSDGLDPVVALPDVQGLVALRNLLCEHLQAAGIPLPSEHGYQPHTTLTYVGQEDPMPLDRLPETVPATFSHVCLVMGGTRSDFPLTGSAEPLVAAGAPGETVQHAGASRKLGDIDRALRERVRAASDAAVRRQLEKANARIASRLNGKPELRAAIADVEPLHYASVLGRDTLASAGIDPEQILGDDYGDLRERVQGWMATAQKQALDVAQTIAPISPEAVAAAESAAASNRDAAWAWLAAALARTAATRLFDPEPVVASAGESDPGFWVSASPIRASAAIAGGFGTGDGSQGLDDNGQPVDPTERLGGVGTGQVIQDALASAGASIEHWVWIYGASARSFEPHVQLEGVTYTSHDAEALANDNGWPETDFFYPGDHDGCDCTEDPMWSTSAPGDGPGQAAADVAEPDAAAAVDTGAGSAALGRLLERHSAAAAEDATQAAGTAVAVAPRSASLTKADLDAAKTRLKSVVAPKIKAAIADGHTSDQLFTDAKGAYTADRLAQQDAVLQKMYDAASSVPNDKQAVMLGGIPGAGKGSSLAAAGLSEDNFLTLNPDVTRDYMLEHGMGIDIEGLSPRETSFLIHEEASQMTQDLAARAQAEGKNVLWDITMDPKAGANPAAGVEKRLGLLNDSGYTTDMIYVQADKATAQKRALGRYAGQAADPDNALGGRPTVSLLGMRSGQHGIAATNEDVFELVRGQAGQWWMFNNNTDGAGPSLIASG